MVTPNQFQAHEDRIMYEINALPGWHAERFDTQRFDKTTQKNLHERGVESVLRHLPDLIATHENGVHVLIECKSVTPRQFQSGNYTIETHSLESCLFWVRSDVPVLIVWHDLSASCPIDVDTRAGKSAGPKSRNGSGDPYYLVERKHLERFSLSLSEYLCRLASGNWDTFDQLSLIVDQP